MPVFDRLAMTALALTLFTGCEGFRGTPGTNLPPDAPAPQSEGGKDSGTELKQRTEIMEDQVRKWMLARDEINDKFARNREAAERKKIWPVEDKFASPEYLALAGPDNAAAEALLKEYYRYDLSRKGPEHFSKENVFIWGGPTPSWGGSMAKDASLKAKEFFGADNVMYVYGPLNEEMLELHRDCKKVICHLGQNCRTKGAAMASDAEEAEALSRYSLKYPNVVGGVIDDMATNYGLRYSKRDYQAMHDAIRRHNPALKLYGVVYAHELDMVRELQAVSDCVDHVILWFWNKLELMEMDLAVEKCRVRFPGKPIMLGIFLFDYGAVCLPNSAETMRYHLEKARRLLAAGKIQDMVILGDREIEKCPEAAAAVKAFLQNEFASRRFFSRYAEGEQPNLR